jgi:hypothetical protein
MVPTRLLGGGASHASAIAGLDRHLKTERVTVQKSLTVGTEKLSCQDVDRRRARALLRQREAVAAIRTPTLTFSLMSSP